MKLQVVNATVKKAMSGTMELHVNTGTYVEMFEPAEEFLKIIALKEGLNNINVKGEVATKPILREVKTSDGELVKLAVFELKDETGRVWVSAWRKHADLVKDLKIGNGIMIKDAYVKKGFGEPLERLDCLLEVAHWIRKYYGKPISIRVDTNGQGLLLNRNREIITELTAAGVDKLSVSLNAHDKETYNQVCRPKSESAFDSVLAFIEEAKGKFDVEVTAVNIPEVDLSKVAKIAQQIGVKFRAREYIPSFW
jgi:TatD family-associated radical SAM protein